MLIIEIIALIFLCKSNGQLALQKGLKPGSWKLYTVLAWLGAEFIGCILGLIMFGQGQNNPLKIEQANFFQISFVAIFCAFGGYLIIRYTLEKKPDTVDDNIKSIGVDDLKPPVK
jgi:hypothetical protein